MKNRAVYRVEDGRTVSFKSMIQDVGKADIVFIGEVHDDYASHALQLATIRALYTAGTLGAIGLEMFRADSQQSLDAWVNDAMPLDRFLPVYYDNWNIAWSKYRDIFEYARSRRVPLVGLNISHTLAAAVARNGFSSLKDHEKKELPPSITCDVDAKYMKFIRKAYAGHAPREDRKFINFCEAQLVWDKSMAWNLIKYRERNPDKTIVVLAGVGHAWKRGMPEQVGRGSPHSYKVVLPVVPHHIDQGSVTPGDADYLVLE